MNLSDLLSEQVISAIAKSAGSNKKETTSVLANALPALVGKMADNASTKDGAESLAKALDDHTTSSGISSLLKNIDAEDGAKILGHILGSDTDSLESAVAKKSDATKKDTANILASAAPILLSVLGSSKKETKTSADGLGDLLGTLLGGGDDDDDDGSTLMSLAGSLLGGGKKDASDVLLTVAGSLLTSALTDKVSSKKSSSKKSSSKKSSSKKSNNDTAELIGDVLGALLGGK